MLNHNIPAGNHVIKAVQYDAPSNQTKLSLCCGQTAWLSMLLTTQYKPEAGDYWIVTDHGTQSLFKKSVFEGATKPMGPKYLSDMFGTYLIDPKAAARINADMGAGDDIARLFLFDPQSFQLTSFADPLKFPFERTTAKPETMGMREENGYVRPAGGDLTSVNDTAQDQPRAKTPTEVAAASATNMNHLLSNVDAQVWAKEFCSINKASDEGAMLSWFACAIMTGMDEANRRRDKELALLNTQLKAAQNVIKSLTAQNDKKQGQINELRGLVGTRVNLTSQLNRLIDTCAAAKLI